MSSAQEIPQWYWDDLRWAREHSAELHDQYEDVWVAIVNQQVVAASASFSRARKIAAQKTGRRPEDIPVEFIDAGISIYGENQSSF